MQALVDDEVKAFVIVIGVSVGGLLLAYLVCVLLCCVSSKCPLRSVWSSCELSKHTFLHPQSKFAHHLN